jgi:hypothetical protein
MMTGDGKVIDLGWNGIQGLMQIQERVRAARR